MFKCEGCPKKYNKKREATKGNTIHGETEFRITTVIRKVIYLNQVRFDKLVSQEGTSKLVSSFKTINETSGTEIVEQKSYCQNCIPKNLEVRTLDKPVERINLVKINRGYRGEN